MTFDSNRVERLLNHAVHALPADLLFLIATYHCEMWETEAEELEIKYNEVVYELDAIVENSRFKYYREALGSEDEAFHFAYISDSENHEPGWILQLSSRVLQYICTHKCRRVRYGVFAT